MIFDNTIAKDNPIRLDILKRFLKLKNWQLISDARKGLLIYQGPLDDINRKVTLVLPTSEEFEDTPLMISKALNLLSHIEQSSIQDLREAITNLGSDFLRQRIITPSNISSIPLPMANKIINTLTSLVSYSACLEEEVQPFFSKGRSIGKKFAEKCRFGQTFVGSFGLSLEMPISLPAPKNATQAPFERRIMIRIAHGIFSLQKAIQEADIAILMNDYKKGFNANLYETMLDLMQAIEGYQIEFLFGWSPEYTLPQELKDNSIARFTSNSAVPFLESAAKSLRRSSESQDTLIIGKIIQLRGDNTIGDEESDELGTSNRMIVIEWETENGKVVLIRAFLSPEEYRYACDAHRDSKQISIRGKPEKPGKYLILTSSSDFQVLK